MIRDLTRRGLRGPTGQSALCRGLNCPPSSSAGQTGVERKRPARGGSSPTQRRRSTVVPTGISGVQLSLDTARKGSLSPFRPMGPLARPSVPGLDRRGGWYPSPAADPHGRDASSNLVITQKSRARYRPVYTCRRAAAIAPKKGRDSPALTYLRPPAAPHFCSGFNARPVRATWSSASCRGATWDGASAIKSTAF